MTTHYLNPDHAVAKMLQENKEKFLAALVHKLGPQILTGEDFTAVDGMILVTHLKADGIHLFTVTREVGEELVRMEPIMPPKDDKP